MIELRFSLPPPKLRRNASERTIRFVLSKLRDQYSELMGREMSMQPNAGIFKEWARRFPIRVYDLRAEVIWRQTGPGDTDNCLGGCKAVFDNLGCAPVTKAGENRYYIGLYESDSQIKRICVERERVAHKKDECVIIRLEIVDV